MKTDEYGHAVDFDTETLNTLFNLYRIKRRFDDGIATRQEIKEALDASCNLWDFLIVDEETMGCFPLEDGGDQIGASNSALGTGVFCIGNAEDNSEDVRICFIIERNMRVENHSVKLTREELLRLSSTAMQLALAME